jgi:hypothetical protein
VPQIHRIGNCDCSSESARNPPHRQAQLVSSSPEPVLSPLPCRRLSWTTLTHPTHFCPIPIRAWPVYGMVNSNSFLDLGAYYIVTSIPMGLDSFTPLVLMLLCNSLSFVFISAPSRKRSTNAPLSLRNVTRFPIAWRTSLRNFSNSVLNGTVKFH